MKKKRLEPDLQEDNFAKLLSLEAILGEVLYEIGVLGGNTASSKQRASQFFDAAFARIERDVFECKGPEDSESVVDNVKFFMREAFDGTVEALKRRASQRS